MVMVESNLLLLAHNTFTVMEYLPLLDTDSMVHNDSYNLAYLVKKLLNFFDRSRIIDFGFHSLFLIVHIQVSAMASFHSFKTDLHAYYY